MIKINISKIEIIVFITGAAVMILELCGARILAPYVGTSMHVWSALLGVILGALSIGYYLGGRLADREPKFKILGTLILAAAINIVLVGALKDYIAVTGAMLGVNTGSIIISLILFAPPSILLGAVSPYAIKLKLKDLKNTGNIAGNLYAISTLGSICGTFLTGFVLIPNFKVTNIIFTLSIVLFFAYFLCIKKKAFKKLGLFFVFLLAWPFTLFVEASYPYELQANTEYSSVIVFDHERSNGFKVRELRLNDEISSVVFQDDLMPAAEYYNYYNLDKFFKKEVTDVLMLGGGAYVVSTDYINTRPNGYIDVVEIDPALTEIAEQYFGLEQNERLEIINQDARVFINQNEKKYDAIYFDLFRSSRYIPWHMTTQEAFEKLYDSLNQDGVLIINAITTATGDNAEFLEAEYKTLSNVFEQVYIFPIKGEEFELPQNIMIVALKNNSFDYEDSYKNLTEDDFKILLDNQYIIPEEKIERAILLTDEYAPVESMILKMIN